MVGFTYNNIVLTFPEMVVKPCVGLRIYMYTYTYTYSALMLNVPLSAQQMFSVLRQTTQTGSAAEFWDNVLL